MSRCKACNCAIKVVWRQPAGASEPLLEDLCLVCQAWAEIAKQPGPMPEEHAKRKPVERCINYEKDIY